MFPLNLSTHSMIDNKGFSSSDTLLTGYTQSHYL
jgi:hypothetical protein